MRRAMVLLGAMLLGGCAGAPKGPPQQVLAEKVAGPKLRIAVVEFENKTVYGARLGTAAADILVTELARTDRFILVERAKLEKLMAEQKLGMTGAVDPDTAAKMGRILGAAAIVTGAVSQFGVKAKGTDILIVESKKQVAEAVVDVRIVDAETSQILYAESGQGEAVTSTGSFLGMGTKSSYDEALEGKALRAAIERFVGNVVKRLQQIPWSCRIAELEGPTLYLDAGRRSGLDPGSVLQIVHLGEEIKSPSTGLVIGRKEKVVGKARVADYFGDDGATATMTEGAGVVKGDLARMIQGENKGY